MDTPLQKEGKEYKKEIKKNKNSKHYVKKQTITKWKKNDTK